MMTYKLNYFSTNNATYAYRTVGTGEPIVLLHGFTGSSATWTYFVEQWKNNFQVITLDLPGHGKTHAREAKTMESFSRDFNELLSHLNIEKAHLVGYSMGGRTALSFAQYYPEKVESLVLESASPGLKTEEERLVRIANDEKLIKRLKDGGLMKFVSFWESIPLFESQKKLPKEIQKTIREERLMQTPKGLIDSLTYMGTGRQPSWWTSLDQLEMPVLLIVGEHDEKFIHINHEMNKHIPDSECVTISDAGHAPHIEQRQKFDKIVMTFIKNQ